MGYSPLTNGHLPIIVAHMNSSSEKLLLARIEEHCKETKIAETTFGRLAINDGKLVPRLRAGGSITLDTLQKIEAAIAAQKRPPNTAEPAAASEPATTGAAA